MMRHPLSALTSALFLLAGPVQALERTPVAPPTSSDPRMRQVTYEPGKVYGLTGVLRSASQVVFAADEEILHVALGDATAWEAAPQGSVLFLKPLALARPTNLIVTTRKGTKDRHYAFELRVRQGGIGPQSAETSFQIRFRYPEDDRAALASALDAEAERLEAQVLQLKLDRGVLQGARNLAYAVQGSAALAPSEASDNGRFTVLRFPGVQAIPAVYGVNEDGSETLVPFDVRGEFLVVHGVMPQLRLRRGRAVACLWNLAHPSQASSPSTGTAAPDVQRTPKPKGAR